MGIYRDLARTPGVIRILCAQLTARLPFGMLSIIMLLHIQLVYGNYTSAGVILAAESIGQAVSGPLASRLMARFSIRGVLAATTIACSALLVTVALTALPLAGVAVIALLIGLTTPPVTPAVRTIYPKMVSGNRISGLYSLDASSQEILWVFGPVIAVFISIQVSTVWGLLLAAVFMLGGGVWLVLSPEVTRVRIPPAKRRFGAVLTRPTVVISTLIGFCFVASFAAIEAGVVAVFGHGGLQSGVILAVLSVSSIIGAFLIGHRAITPWSMTVRSAVVLVGVALCLVSLDPIWLGVALFLGGFGVAPMLAALYTVVSATVKFSETAEAFGWVGTGQLIGVAAGSALAGVTIDELGGKGGVLISVMFLVITVLASVISSRWLPDLRGREVGPMTDTVPVQVPEHKS